MKDDELDREETAISERISLVHDFGVLHVIERDNEENFISLTSEEILELVRYIFKNELI